MKSLGTMPALEPEVYRWKRGDFRDFLGSNLVDDPSRFELLDGLVFQRPMENPSHSLACGLVQDALLAVLPKDCHLRCQHPLAIDDETEPDPDFAVVRGNRRDFTSDHPTFAELVVEVSDTTLHIDKGRKLRAYARNEIQEYWIVNLADKALEVCRRPDRGNEEFGESFKLGMEQSATPLFAPDATIRVRDLLP